MDENNINTNLSEYYEELEKNDLGALWKNLHHMVTREPVHDIAPYLWKLDTIRNHLLQAASLPLGKDAERRVIYRQNSSLNEPKKLAHGLDPIQHDRLHDIRDLLQPQLVDYC